MKREGQKSEGRSQKNGGRKRVEGVNRRGQERKPSPAFAAEEQIAEWLAAELPGLELVFMSGYPDELGVDAHDEVSVLTKPFSTGSLLAKVRERIAARRLRA